MRLRLRPIGLPFLALATLVFAIVATGSPSPSGAAYATALLLLGLAGAVRSVGEREAVTRRLAQGGAVIGAVALTIRLASVQGGRELSFATPRGSSARFVDRMVDEGDVSVNVARAIRWTGFLRDPDVSALPETMERAYARLGADVGTTPSPVLATYLGLEGPGADDTMTLGPVDGTHDVVVFLHGFGGSFTLPCWVVAQAAARAGFSTVCPSTRWVGDWWSADGEATLRETVASLRRGGDRRVVLAGLSNGAIGATRLAPRMPGAFAGLVLVSGADPDATAVALPVLAVQGRLDAQIPAEFVEAYATRVGGTYVSLNAGHFALLTHEDGAAAAITSFLRALPPEREPRVASAHDPLAAPPAPPQHTRSPPSPR